MTLFLQDTSAKMGKIETAADTGSAKAQTYCGILLMCGTGCDADPEKAAEWFKLAADQGDNEANYRLGWMYLQGTGVKRDKQAAREYFSAAVEKDEDPRALFELGRLSLKKKDYISAFQYFSGASGKNHVKATLELAEMFEKGLGMPKDKDRGMMLRNQAAEWLVQSK